MMGRAVILTGTGNGPGACAAAARISTTGGGAVERYQTKHDPEKDISLVKKVLSSGHQSIFEHQTFFVAFENVSVAVEQFVIECRLGSYTVKSRRYVDFSGAGYVTPDTLEERFRGRYEQLMESLFSVYGELTAAGIAREDARFVLPYCFCSNFYMTMNARSLYKLVAEMRFGRGSAFTEIRELGESLASQLDETWPGVSDLLGKAAAAPAAFDISFLEGESGFTAAQPEAVLKRADPDAESTLKELMRANGRPADMSVSELIRSGRPRELEFLNYRFTVKDVSLACVTHFTRHRIQSLLVPDIREALRIRRFIVPDPIRESSELYAKYVSCFEKAFSVCAELIREGMPAEFITYFCLAGMVVPLEMGMNARELHLFLRLRTCERAQWEIRRLARSMLAQLKAVSPGVFDSFGPGCISMDKCPEGRLSCGNPPKL